MKLEGCYVALASPFKEDKSLDLSSYEKLIDYCIEGKVAGLVPCGTTGEIATLTVTEHKELVKIAVKKKEELKGRIEVIAGAGANWTEKAITLSKQAEDTGADAVLIVIPYYNKPTQEGIYQHIEAIAKSIKIPIVVYNIPSRTVVNLQPTTLKRLAEIDNVIAIKEASQDLKQQSQMVLLTKDKIKLLSGDDFTLLPTLSIGGRGIISASANVVPRDMSLLIQKFQENDIESAKELHYKLFPVIEGLFIETNPAPVKEALYMLGIIETAELRLPLVRISPENKEKLKKILTDYGFKLINN
jgi:4-hydroxy-tetrahydrodipicolinate synthase